MTIRELRTPTETDVGLIRGRAAPFEVVPLASAVAVVGGTAYVVCAIVALVSLEMLIGFFEPWFHGVSLQLLRPTEPVVRLDAFVVGLLTFTTTVWLGTAAAAWLYNGFARR